MSTEKQIDIGNDVWGYAYEIQLDQQLEYEIEAVEILDEFCRDKNLNELYNHWNKVAFDEAKELLKNCLTFDIAYSSCRISKEENVEKIFTRMVSLLDVQAIRFCFTNCIGTPWRKVRNGFSWNSLTEQTFDIGVVLIDNKRILFVYFMSED